MRGRTRNLIDYYVICRGVEEGGHGFNSFACFITG
jgi:hypothetical protein